jgi:5-methylcytosine-specific restriction endonuclease McrA
MYNEIMQCIRCGQEITSKSKKYCSRRCGKLYLKKIYRQKHKKQIREYNNEWKRRGIRGSPANSRYLREHLLANPLCAKCGTSEAIHVCHIKPRSRGGKNIGNLITLCQKHHYQFDNLLRQFWGVNEVEVIGNQRVTMMVEVVNVS